VPRELEEHQGQGSADVVFVRSEHPIRYLYAFRYIGWEADHKEVSKCGIKD
jgi:hypothetical protein